MAQPQPKCGSNVEFSLCLLFDIRLLHHRCSTLVLSKPSASSHSRLPRLLLPPTQTRWNLFVLCGSMLARLHDLLPMALSLDTAF